MSLGIRIEEIVTTSYQSLHENQMSCRVLEKSR